MKALKQRSLPKAGVSASLNNRYTSIDNIQLKTEKIGIIILLTSEVRHAEKLAIHGKNKPVMLQSIVHGGLLLGEDLLAR